MGKPTKLWVGLRLIYCFDHAVIRIDAAVAATGGLIILSACQTGHVTNAFNKLMSLRFHLGLQKRGGKV